MMLHFLIFTFCLILKILIVRSELCDPVSIPYVIGQNVTILDIPAEQISLLPTTCTKEIRVDDSVYSSIHVEEASFSGNEGFEYSNMGTVSKVFVDSATLTNLCSNHAGGTEWTQPVVKGLTLYQNTDLVCIRFEPELNHRSLGYHVKGGRVKIALQVKFAYCHNENKKKNNNNNALTSGNAAIKGNSEGCRPICSKTGVESTCEDSASSVRPSTSTVRSLLTPVSPESFTSTTTARTSDGRPASTTISLVAPRNTTTTFPITVSTLTAPVKSTVGLQRSSPVTATKRSSTTMTRTTTHADEHQVTTNGTTVYNGNTRTTPGSFESNRNLSENAGESTMSPNLSIQIPMLHTLIHPSVSPIMTSTRSDSDIGNNTLGHYGSVTHLETLENRTWEGVSNHAAHEATPANNVRTPAEVDSAKTFGLLEGLYVLIGCLVVFVLVAVVTYCIRKSQEKNVSVSPINSHLGNQMLSTTSYMSQWRDNWLVRYHGNKQDGGENGDISDDEVDINHEQFEQKTDQDIYNTHADVFVDTEKDTQDRYSDPWPLIRLDSEFVRNTKSVDSVSSDERNADTCNKIPMAKPILKQKVSKASSDSGIGRTGCNDIDSADLPNIKSSSLKDASDLKKDRFRYIKRVNSHVRSRGSYNVSRAAKRSDSLSSYDTIGQVLTASNRVLDNNKDVITDTCNGPCKEIPELHPQGFPSYRVELDSGYSEWKGEKQCSSV